MKQQHRSHGFVMAELPVDDVLQIDFHAPNPEELGSALSPKTPYMDSVLKRLARPRRFHRKQHKPRRDKGIAKDTTEVATKRQERGAPKPEAEVVRDREQCIQSVMNSSVQQRMAMTSSSFHGTAVPADSGKCVTSETEAARAKVTKKWQSGDSNGIGVAPGSGIDIASASQKRPQDSQEWGPRKRRNVPVPLLLVSPETLRDGDFKLELRETVLGRRKWICTTNVEQFTNKFPDHAHHAYLVRKLHDRTLSTDRVALLCRFFGGCLLTEPWVHKAFSAGDAELECIHYQGIMHEPKIVMFSTECKEHRQFASVVKHITQVAHEDKFRLTVVDSMTDMERRYDDWKDSKGERSRPWVALCIAVAHEVDYSRMVKRIGAKKARMVRTLDSMLNEWSKVDNDWMCPKSW